MKLEQQVCSLELAKRLKELGMKQESLFFYAQTFPLKNKEWGWRLRCHVNDGFRGYATPDQTTELGSDSGTACAFTVAELGERLKNAGAKATMKAYSHLYDFREGTEMVGALGLLRLLTDPDALAKMLVYLLENNLISASSLS